VQKMVYGKGNGCRGHYVQEFATISSRDFRTQAGLTGRRGPKRSQLSCAFVVNWEAREFTNTLAILTKNFRPDHFRTHVRRLTHTEATISIITALRIGIISPTIGI